MGPGKRQVAEVAQLILAQEEDPLFGFPPVLSLHSCPQAAIPAQPGHSQVQAGPGKSSSPASPDFPTSLCAQPRSEAASSPVTETLTRCKKATQTMADI